MRLLWLILILISPPAFAQTRAVDPADLELFVTVENTADKIFPQEMVLVTINGIYRRHITLEKLEPPDLDGFNWLQLGEDIWFDSTLYGVRVKNFRRRMALYPQRAGTLTIPPFVHHLNLVDEGDDWFQHDIRTAPVKIEVAPAPSGDGWFFPVKRLRITDNWSNPPDQLEPGGGVLRIVRVEAVGVGPSMIPPMPALRSPSGRIFAHPEKRLVELSPEGPVSVAFWRWTVRPGNNRSAILEPIEVEYFDTVGRQSHTVTLSAQRVAMADAPPVPPPAPPVTARPRLVALVAVGMTLVAFTLLLAGRQADGMRRLRIRAARRWPRWSRDGRRLMRAARRGDLATMRRVARSLATTTPCATRTRALEHLDHAIFAPHATLPDPIGWARDFLNRSRIGTNAPVATSGLPAPR